MESTRIINENQIFIHHQLPRLVEDLSPHFHEDNLSDNHRCVDVGRPRDTDTCTPMHASSPSPLAERHHAYIRIVRKSDLTIECVNLNRFWRLSVPSGGDRDHPLANPFGPSSPNLEAVALDPILVMVGGREMLKDRVQDYAARLKGMGKKVKCVEYEGKQHGFFTNDPYSDVGDRVIQDIREFVLESSN